MSGVLLVLNGPNLNLLGERDPAQYGTTTLGDLEKLVHTRAGELGFEVEFRQSNHEGVLVDWIQEWRHRAAGIIINPAAYSHTSVAIRDALDLVRGPIVEVHLSDIYSREEFRRNSYVSAVADEVISGRGAHGYVLAVESVVRILTT